MRRYNRDDVLFAHQLTGQVYEVHLTFKGSKETTPAFPACKAYESLQAWMEIKLVTDQDEWYLF